MPRLRSQPDDFIVDEIPEGSFAGEGDHTLLLIEKRLQTTDDVLRELARITGLHGRDLGYAGRKDKNAVTRQWFSVPLLDLKTARELDLMSGRVLAVDRHTQKLRPGALRGNRFEIVIREVSQSEARRAQELLEQILDRGLPNRFGPQRFGHGGRNIEKGVAILRAEHLRIERRTAWLLVSAVQSAVFNEVLARRPFPLDQVILGDVAIDNHNGDLFIVDDLENAQPRAASFEISPTGPMFGTKMKRPSGAVATLESAAMASLGLPEVGEITPPRGIKIFGHRRPLRIKLDGVDFMWRDGAVYLRFELPAGSFASTLVEELFPNGFEEGPRYASIRR